MGLKRRMYISTRSMTFGNHHCQARQIHSLRTGGVRVEFLTKLGVFGGSLEPSVVTNCLLSHFYPWYRDEIRVVFLTQLGVFWGFGFKG